MIGLTLRRPGGGGGRRSTPNRFLQFFLGIGEAFIPNKIFSCSLILGTYVHEKTLQIGPTVLALNLDEGRVLSFVAVLIWKLNSRHGNEMTHHLRQP